MLSGSAITTRFERVSSKRKHNACPGRHENRKLPETNKFFGARQFVALQMGVHVDRAGRIWTNWTKMHFIPRSFKINFLIIKTLRQNKNFFFFIIIV